MYDVRFEQTARNNTNVAAGARDVYIGFHKELKFFGKSLPGKRLTYYSSGTIKGDYFCFIWSDANPAGTADGFDIDWRFTFTDI